MRSSLFPSPSGVSHFSIVSPCPNRCGIAGFRPVPGYLISQYSCASFHSNLTGFRPLPGYLISQSAVRRPYKLNPNMFPSPSGVSHFSILTMRYSRLRPLSFPSPSGVSHFSIRYSIRLDVEAGFRPLPGYLISQWTKLEYEKERDSGFRPLPGYLISQSFLRNMQSSFLFPSPSGVSHFSIMMQRSASAQIAIGFRPLPGYLISQCRPSTQRFDKWPFPSPSGVSHFSMGH